MNYEENDIDNLITRSLTGETTAEEEQQLRTWIAATAENNQHYQKLQKSFSIASQYYRTKQVPDLNLDAEWNRFLKSIDKPKTNNVRTLFSTTWLRVAAAVMVVAASVVLYNYFSNAGLSIIESGLVAQEVTLPDGSLVTLNQNSKLTYSSSFNNSDRHISLEGEAFFEVAHNPNKPFTISVKDASVEVLGTSFNVRGYKASEVLEVVVATGTVKLSTPDKTAHVTLQAGDRGIYNPQQQTVQNEINTDVNFNAWKTRRLTFTEANLQTVVETLNKVYQSNIVIAVPVPDTCLVTVSFDQQDLTAVLNVLKVTLNLEYTIQKNKIEITRAGC